MSEAERTLLERYRGLVSALPDRGVMRFRITVVGFEEDPEFEARLQALGSQAASAGISIFGGDPDEDVELAADLVGQGTGEEWVNPYENAIISTYNHQGEDVFAAAPALAELLAYLARNYATLDVVRALFPDAREPDPTDELSPLHRAIARGDLETLEALIAEGDALEVDPLDGSPLGTAVRFGQGAALARLLAEGGRADEHDHTGWSLLHSAAVGNHLEIARLLLDAGADPQAADSTGRTPIDVARENPRAERLLETLLASRRQ